MAEEVSKADFESVAEKLWKFAEGLPEKERAIVGGIVARAQTAEEEDVSGFALGDLGTQRFDRAQFGNQLLTGATGLRDPGIRWPDIVPIRWSW